MKYRPRESKSSKSEDSKHSHVVGLNRPMVLKPIIQIKYEIAGDRAKQDELKIKMKNQRLGKKVNAFKNKTRNLKNLKKFLIAKLRCIYVDLELFCHAVICPVYTRNPLIQTGLPLYFKDYVKYENSKIC